MRVGVRVTVIDDMQPNDPRLIELFRTCHVFALPTLAETFGIAAVEAGARAAEKVGELVAVHVIPNPAVGLEAILPARRYISKYHPEDMRPPVKFVDDQPTNLRMKKTVQPDSAKKSEPKNRGSLYKIDF